MPLDKVTKNVDDFNQLLEKVTVLIPYVGGLVSAVVKIFADRNEQVPVSFQEAIAAYDAEIQKLKANDAAWRASHPEV